MVGLSTDRVLARFIVHAFYVPDRREGAISVAFVRPSVAYIANNSRTQRPSVPKIGRKVPHLRCDSHTSFKVKRSKITVRGGRAHTMSSEPGGHTACLCPFQFHSSQIGIFHRDRPAPVAVLVSQLLSDDNITHASTQAQSRRASAEHRVGFSDCFVRRPHLHDIADSYTGTTPSTL